MKEGKKCQTCAGYGNIPGEGKCFVCDGSGRTLVSTCPQYLHWLETAAEREAEKAEAKKQEGKPVASVFAEGVAVGLRLAATEFADGMYSANVRDHRCLPDGAAGNHITEDQQ
jgi:RecJ-like exonuclease